MTLEHVKRIINVETICASTIIQFIRSSEFYYRKKLNLSNIVKTTCVSSTLKKNLVEKLFHEIGDYTESKN